MHLCPTGPLSAYDTTFFEEIYSVESKARLLTKPIALAFLITSMVLLAILTPGGASTRPSSVRQPPWSDLGPAAGFKAFSRSALLPDGFYIANKGPRPSKASADHRIAPGDWGEPCPTISNAPCVASGAAHRAPWP